MKPQAFKKLDIDEKTNKLQENIGIKLQEYDNQPFIKGNLLTSVVINAANTTINHGLNAVPTGWLILDKNADSRIWRTSAFDDKTLTLRASAQVTVNLWVF